MIDVATCDDARVNQSAPTGEYAIHQFKEFANVVPANNECYVRWQGQTDVDPATSPIYLQIYNHTTSTWDTINKVTLNYGDPLPYAGSTAYYVSPGANVDFDLTASVPDLTNYTLANIVSFRVYQYAP